MATLPDWELRELTDPLGVVPHWYGGPFPGWIKNFYGGQSTLRFPVIIQQPFVQGHDSIPGLVAHFPKLTILTTAEDDQGRVFVVEGMHRACALANLASTGKPLVSRVFTAHGKIKPGQSLSFS